MQPSLAVLFAIDLNGQEGVSHSCSRGAAKHWPLNSANSNPSMSRQRRISFTEQRQLVLAERGLKVAVGFIPRKNWFPSVASRSDG
jgi:hypothetical protein